VSVIDNNQSTETVPLQNPVEVYWDSSTGEVSEGSAVIDPKIGQCFVGQEFGRDWLDNEWHNYVIFDVGNTTSANWRITVLFANVFRPQPFAAPENGKLKVGFGWRPFGQDDAPIIGLTPNAFVACEVLQ
jgi:hypothetical protein